MDLRKYLIVVEEIGADGGRRRRRGGKARIV